MKKVIKKIKSLIINIFSLFFGFIIGRNKKNVLLGSWGGQKYADNTRFLFEYLDSNRNQLKLKHVVWATRKKEIYEELKKKNKEVCLVGSFKSFLCHLKCGIHIICNMSFSFDRFLPDIDTKFSCGAKKIQLWHGVGVKRVGLSSIRLYQKKNKSNRIISGLKTIMSEGCWINQYVLCTSSLNKEYITKSLNIKKERAFISSYPRYCNCLEVTEKEKQIIHTINSFDFSILYLPTFRKDYANYKHPLETTQFLKYLKNNNIIFIEKPHTASSYREKYVDENILYLNDDFDVNVLIYECSCIISDYSSAAFVGIHIHKPVIFYVPDLKDFEKNDVGLFIDIDKYFNGMVANNIEEIVLLLEKIRDNCFFDKKTSDIYSKADSDFFDNNQKSYKEIWNDINNAKNCNRK